MYKKKITKEEMRDMPIKSFDGDIFLIDTKEKLNEVIPILEKQKILGFDTETRPAFKKGVVHKVALLQLSTKDQAFLFRLNRIGLPKSLTKILSDKNIIKVGAAIRDDIKTLRKLHLFKPEVFIDLQEYVKQFNIESFSLAKLSAIVLDFKISKRQQLSNWENETLKDAQLKYAATDAWVSYEIYCQLRKKVSSC